MPGADVLGISSGGGMPDASGQSFEGQTADDRQQMLQAHRQNIALGLLAAGLSTLAQPHYRGERGGTLRALGAGGLGGLAAYEAGEQASQKAQEDRVKQRELTAYRQQEVDARLASVAAQQHRTDVIQGNNEAARAEAARHNKAGEAGAEQARAIQLENANSNAARAGAESQRVQIEAGKYGLSVAQFNRQMKPYGADNVVNILKGYGVANAEALGPYLGALPRADATKLMNLAIIAARQKNTTRVYTDDNNKVHVLTLDKDGNIAKDSTAKEPAAPRGKAKTNDLSEKYAAVGLSGDGTAPAAPTTPAATPAAAPTPAMEVPAGATKISQPVPSGTKDGTYHNAKGQKIIVKDGVGYMIPGGPSGVPASGSL